MDEATCKQMQADGSSDSRDHYSSDSRTRTYLGPQPGCFSLCYSSHGSHLAMYLAQKSRCGCVHDLPSDCGVVPVTSSAFSPNCRNLSPLFSARALALVLVGGGYCRKSR